MTAFLDPGNFLAFCAMIPLLVGLVIITAYILLNGRRTQLLLYFLLVCLSLLILQLSLLLRIISPGSVQLWLAISLQYLGLCLFALMLTLFGVSDLMHNQVTIRIFIPLSLVPAILVLFIITNPVHLLFLQSFKADEQTPGPLFIMIGAIIFAYLFAGSLICSMGMIRRLVQHRITAIVLSACLIIPSFVFLADVIGLIQVHVTVTAQLFIAAIIMYSLSAMRFHFLDITPLARRIIMNEIDIGLAITRLDNRIIDANLAFTRLFAEKGPFAHLAQIGQICPALQVGLHDDLPIHREVLLETATGSALYDWTVQTIVNHSGRPVGRMHQLSELENERQLRLLLAGQNEQLELANQTLQKHVQIASELRSMNVRNRLAREMHDSLGHLLIILIAHLERLSGLERLGSQEDVSRLDCGDQTGRANRLEELETAASLLRKVLDQLPEPPAVLSKPVYSEAMQEMALIEPTQIPGEGDAASPEHPVDEDRSAAGDLTVADALTDRLKSMSDDLRRSGLLVEIQLRGPVENIPVEHNDDLIQVCREAVTNAVKHGHATTINVFVIASQNQYELIILDNGAGDPDFEKGFGLINMEKRVASLGGTLRLQSDSSGFGVYAAIPWPASESTQ